METQIIHLKLAGENEYWNYFELLQGEKKRMQNGLFAHFNLRHLSPRFKL